MKYIKVFEEIKFGRIINPSINDLTEDSKKIILKLFGTLNIPYDIDIYNHSKHNGKIERFDSQGVDIRNNPMDYNEIDDEFKRACLAEEIKRITGDEEEEKKRSQF